MTTTSPGQGQMKEYGPQDYYPSGKLRLVIRFDEMGQSGALGKPPTKPSIVLKGVQDPSDPLQVIPDPDDKTGKRLIIASKAGTGTDALIQALAKGTSIAQVAGQDGMTYPITGIIPHTAEWSQNGIRTADQLTATIRYVDCPIDPRTVRSAAIAFYLGTVRAEDYAAGISGSTNQDVYGEGTPNPSEPLNVVPDTYVDGNGNDRTNLRFQGFIDKWIVEFNDSGEPMIRIECRDHTSLLIETPAPSQRPVDPKIPINKAVAKYLTFAPAFEGLTVSYLPATDTPPAVGDAIKLLPTAQGPYPAKSGAGNGTTKASVWDYLTDVCRAIGHGIRVDGTNIIIQRTRSLTSSKAPCRADDPFQGRAVPGTSETLQVRRFIWGRNLKEMRVSRSFTKHAPQNISVRSYSTTDKRVMVGRFPLPEDPKTGRGRPKTATPGDTQTDQKWLELIVDDEVHDEKQLRIIAQEVYESMGRQELQVELVTNNLASFGGDNLDPDILDMKPGDTFDLMTNRDVDGEFHTMGVIEQQILSASKGAKMLSALGYPDNLAASYLKAYTNAGFLTQYRLKSMKTSWSCDSGITFHIQGVNYIAVRADASNAAGEEPGGTQ